MGVSLRELCNLVGLPTRTKASNIDLVTKSGRNASLLLYIGALQRCLVLMRNYIGALQCCLVSMQNYIYAL